MPLSNEQSLNVTFEQSALKRYMPLVKVQETTDISLRVNATVVFSKYMPLKYPPPLLPPPLTFTVTSTLLSPSYPSSGVIVAVPFAVYVTDLDWRLGAPCVIACTSAGYASILADSGTATPLLCMAALRSLLAPLMRVSSVCTPIGSYSGQRRFYIIGQRYRTA